MRLSTELDARDPRRVEQRDLTEEDAPLLNLRSVSKGESVTEPSLDADCIGHLGIHFGNGITPSDDGLIGQLKKQLEFTHAAAGESNNSARRNENDNALSSNASGNLLRLSQMLAVPQEYLYSPIES